MVLKLADLVRVERRGQFQVYSLNTTVLQDLMTEVLDWFGGMDPATDRSRAGLSDGTGEAAGEHRESDAL
jgi:hypothetical protein